MNEREMKLRAMRSALARLRAKGGDGEVGGGSSSGTVGGERIYARIGDAEIDGPGGEVGGETAYGSTADMSRRASTAETAASGAQFGNPFDDDEERRR